MAEEDDTKPAVVVVAENHPQQNSTAIAIIASSTDTKKLNVAGNNVTIPMEVDQVIREVNSTMAVVTSILIRPMLSSNQGNSQ